MTSRLHDEPVGTRPNHPESLTGHRWRTHGDRLHECDWVKAEHYPPGVFYCETHDAFVRIPDRGHGGW